MLFGLQNDDVIIRRKDEEQKQEQNGIIPKSVYDTNPLRKTIEKFLKQSGLEYIKDLQCRTDILTCEIEPFHLKLETRWIKTTNKKDDKLKVEDVLMCSTAIPVLFPCQRIGLHWYWDGGTKGTFDDYDNNIPNEINKLYVISPQRYRIIEELEHLNLPKSTQDDIVKHYDCGNKQFLFPLRLA